MGSQNLSDLLHGCKSEVEIVDHVTDENMTTWGRFEQKSERYGGIPSNLLFYGGLAFVQLILYIFLSYFGCEADKDDVIGDHPPSLWKLIISREDKWIQEERGYVAINYFKFLRSLMFLSLIMLVLSMISLAINLSFGARGENNLQVFRFKHTTIANIPDGSKYISFLVTAHAILVGAVWGFMSYHARYRVADIDLNSPTNELSRTVVVEHFDNKYNSIKKVENWWKNRYPMCKLVDIVWGYNTEELHRINEDITFLEETLEIMGEMKRAKNSKLFDNRFTIPFYLCNCGSKKRGDYKYMLKILKLEMQSEACDIINNHLLIVFLTFETPMQARRVVMAEKGIIPWDKRTTIASRLSVDLAPPPASILWPNLGTDYYKSLVYLVLAILLYTSFSSPAALAEILELLGTAPAPDHTKNITDIVLIPTTTMASEALYFASNLGMIPVLVRLHSTSFGHWSYNNLATNYMITLYFWQVATLIIFPYFRLTSVGLIKSITNFLTKDFIKYLMDEPFDTDPKVRWECKFLLQENEFIVKLMITTSLLTPAITLWRYGNQFYVLSITGWYYGSKAERIAAKKYGMRYNRWMARMTLITNYAHVLMMFTVASMFFIITPFLTPLFVMYLIIKYIVDLDLIRNYYTYKDEQNYKQDILVHTAIKLMMFSGLIIQGVSELNVYVRIEEKTESIATACLTIYMLTFVTFIFLQSSGWKFPFKLFPDVIRRQGVTFNNTPYIDPLLLKNYNMYKIKLDIDK